MELIFNSDTKHRKDWFTGISFSHPAKMILPLQIWIIDNYTQPGDIILDPMAGSGTILVGCSMGRNVVCVELENKFCDIINGNWEKIKQRGAQLGYSMGWVQILQGDARQLEGVLCDAIVTSPPYAETLQGSGAEAARKRIAEGKYKGLRPDVWTSKGNIAGSTFGDGYSNNPENIGQLPYGKLDAVITSPPYQAEPTVSEKYLKIRRETGRDTNQPSSKYQKYSAQVDSIITSPPYEEILSGGHKSKLGDKKVQGSSYEVFGQERNKENIGNLKSDSYLSAMLQVYQSCYAVLKPQGVMVLVTKNFIRNQQEVRLDEDTIKLCEQAGFTFQERHYRKLKSQSFWRTIYRQRYPDAPVLDKEDILVFKKGRDDKNT